jgi:peptidoglycan/xylan/chitin deacetylase (PgdA/CDA1 family)
MTLRLDRWATLYVASPLRRLAPAGEPSIPILMYHSIAENHSSNIHPYFQTTTSPKVFAAQLKFLRDEGYSTCTLSQALRQLRQNETKKSVVLTFDDGFRNFYRSAFPLLNENGFTATVFLPTAYIGENPIAFKNEDCLTWPEVRELKQYGIDFGSHTVTHPWLRELSLREIDEEITKSKETIERELGCAIDSFAYPYAFPQTETDFTAMLRDLLLAAGYTNGVCTTVGRANKSSEPLFLERLPVNSCDDLALLKAKLDGAYDWIATSQRVTKMAKSWLRPHPRYRANLPVSNDIPWRPQANQ